MPKRPIPAPPATKPAGQRDISPVLQVCALLLYAAAIAYLATRTDDWSAGKGKKGALGRAQELIDDQYETASEQRVPVP